jgi:SRSO17 transposase
LLSRVAGRFGRVEPRRRARAFVLGLLADLPRKDGWTIAEHAGDPNPDGMQHLLGRAVWDHDGVRDDVRAYVVEHLGDPDAVLVIDETGDLKVAKHWLLVRRNRTTGELAFYRCWTPRPVSLATLVRVAGGRWTIEERFQTGKGLCGLDQHQVRRWRSWYRWTTLAMLAHAVLVVLAARHRTRHPPSPGLIPLTCNEVSHLFVGLAARPLGHRLRWSLWRRRHQARARTCHYRRQAT